MYGLLGQNFDDPKTQGILGLALGLLSGSGPSVAKRGFASILGDAGQQGMQQYRVAQELRGREEERKQEQQLRQMRIDALLKAQEDAAHRQMVLQRALSPVTQSEALMAGGGPTVTAAEMVGQRKPVDFQNLIAQGLDPEVVKALAESRDYGKPTVARTVDIEGPNGEKLTQQVDSFGRPVGKPMPAYVAPSPVNQGDRTTFVKPTAGLSLPIGMSQADQQRIALDRARLGLEQRRVALSERDDRRDKPPAGYRWKEDGSLEAIPGGPAEQKGAKKTEAASRLTGVLQDLFSNYTELSTQGGTVDYRRGTVSNVTNRIAASPPGQLAGQMFGTREQSLRDAIEQTRPLLINYIRQSSDMGARGMDSEKELQFYLAAATDPTKDLRANLEAMARLDEAYGTGELAGTLRELIRREYGGQNPQGESWEPALPPRSAIDAELKRRGQ